MQSGFYKNDINGLFSYLTRGGKEFRPFIKKLQPVYRYNKTSRFEEIVTEIKADVAYSISIIEGKHDLNDKLILDIKERKYVLTLAKDMMSSEKDLKFNFEFNKSIALVYDVRFVEYIGDFMKAESYVDDKIKDAISKDLISILSEERTTLGSWRLSTSEKAEIGFFDYYTFQN